MGKASKWFRALLGIKKEDSPPAEPKPAKKRWSFVKSYREKDRATKTTTAGVRRRVSYGEPVSPYSVSYSAADDGVDPNKHAMAVAVATAAVADAAVAAAQAAAAVVRMTSSGRSAHFGGNAGTVAYDSGIFSEVWAAIKIQSHFRAYLSRRALKALKALVKLQALVRGHIVRKQTADMLRHLQALIRAQARARAGRTQVSESPHSSSKSSQFLHPGPLTPEKFEHAVRAKSTKHEQSLMLKQRNRSKSSSRLLIMDQEKTVSSMKSGPTDDERTDKILEIDNGKHQLASKSRNHIQSSHHVFASDQISHSFTTSKDSTNHQTVRSPSSCEVQSLSPLKLAQEDAEECAFCTADNSPQFYSASSRGGSSRRGPFTPTKSDGLRSYLSGFSDHPNYMACTESSRAKVRSLSAPKQRPQFERTSSTMRYSIHGHGDSRSTTHRISALHASFTSKAYPGSGCLDRLAMPVRSDANGYNAGQWIRY